MKNVKSTTRLYVLVSRNAPVGVIFRRGPSHQVLLIRWNLELDTFEPGQWLKGRIYERRCDLTPEGDMLLYFAANWKKPYQSWSAISRPPYLTALALWPKGDGWGGGGQFVSRDRIALSHRQGEMAIATGFSTPNWLTVQQFGDRPGWGEDNPVWSERLQRDGWRLTISPEATKNDFGAKVWIEYDPPITWQKTHPLLPEEYALQMLILGVMERNGPWYLIEHSIVRKSGNIETIGRSEWADWSRGGDLLFSQSGCLYRLRCIDGVLGAVESSEMLADFSELEFQGVEAPKNARLWPTKVLKARGK
jgi:hypothetical protein